MTFAELLADVRRTALDAYRYQDVPFERIVNEVAPRRSLDATPLVQVAFAFQNVDAEPLRLTGLTLEPYSGGTPRVHFDVSVAAAEADGQIRMWWGYKLELFHQWRIETRCGTTCESSISSPSILRCLSMTSRC